MHHLILMHLEQSFGDACDNLPRLCLTHHLLSRHQIVAKLQFRFIVTVEDEVVCLGLEVVDNVDEPVGLVDHLETDDLCLQPGPLLARFEHFLHLETLVGVKVADNGATHRSTACKHLGLLVLVLSLLEVLRPQNVVNGGLHLGEVEEENFSVVLCEAEDSAKVLPVLTNNFSFVCVDRGHAQLLQVVPKRLFVAHFLPEEDEFALLRPHLEELVAVPCRHQQDFVRKLFLGWARRLGFAC